MVKKQPFDNLMQVFKTTNTHVASSAVVSTELDLDLPRGYIAKIEKVIIRQSLDSNPGTSFEVDRLSSALIRDPDDNQTLAMPDDDVEHDVIADMESTFFSIADGTNNNHMFTQPTFRKIVEFNEKLDVVTARNMRFNSANSNDVNTLRTDVEVYYTLESVSSNQILNLLDIL